MMKCRDDKNRIESKYVIYKHTSSVIRILFFVVVCRELVFSVRCSIKIVVIDSLGFLPLV